MLTGMALNLQPIDRGYNIESFGYMPPNTYIYGFPCTHTRLLSPRAMLITDRYVSSPQVFSWGNIRLF